jgi:hypothetical protein
VKLIGVAFAVLAIFALPARSTGDRPVRVPLMRAVEPAITRAGQIVVVTGGNLNEPEIGGVFLIDKKERYEVKILAKTGTAIRFEVPGKLAPGRYRLGVLVTEPELTFLEEPVQLIIEEGVSQ